MLLLAALVFAPSQEPAKPTLSPMFGNFVLGVGDVDGDKTPDFVIGDEGWQPSGSPAALWLLSGKDAHEIHAFHAGDLELAMPMQVAPAGDIDADTLADLWLMITDERDAKTQRVVLWSGKSREIFRDADATERDAALTGKYSQQPARDLDGDGTAELFLYRDEGGIEVRSGASSKLLWTTSLVTPRMNVHALDDVNDDGVRDVLCPDPDAGIAEGVVHCLSGANGKLLWTADGGTESDWWYFGETLSVIGDLDGDGVRDWLVGGFNHRSHMHGTASLRSGRSGAPLATFHRRERGIVVSGPLFAKPR